MQFVIGLLTSSPPTPCPREGVPLGLEGGVGESREGADRPPTARCHGAPYGGTQARCVEAPQDTPRDGHAVCYFRWTHFRRSSVHVSMAGGVFLMHGSPRGDYVWHDAAGPLHGCLLLLLLSRSPAMCVFVCRNGMEAQTLFHPLALDGGCCSRWIAVRWSPSCPILRACALCFRCGTCSLLDMIRLSTGSPNSIAHACRRLTCAFLFVAPCVRTPLRLVQ